MTRPNPLADEEYSSTIDALFNPRKSSPWFLPKAERRFPYQLDAKLGRAVELKKGLDVQRALMIMKGKLNRNRVIKDYHQQKFHERPGLKRKRLASQRWRKRFRVSFIETVNRVRYLQKQGW